MVGLRAKDGTVVILLSPIPGFCNLPPLSPHPLDFGLRKKDTSFLGKLRKIQTQAPQPILNIFGNNPLPILPPPICKQQLKQKDLKMCHSQGKVAFPQNYRVQPCPRVVGRGRIGQQSKPNCLHTRCSRKLPAQARNTWFTSKGEHLGDCRGAGLVSC